MSTTNSRRFAMREVLLARHGETTWSRIGRRQGILDAPLTEEGVAQVRSNAELIAGLSIDGLFSSPLGRALSSAEHFGKQLGLRVAMLDDLHEVDHGAMGGLTNDEIRVAFPGELERRAGDLYTWRFPGGESYVDADERAHRALLRISEEGSRFPLVVSHEMIGRMLVKQLLGLSADEALRLRHPHEVVYRIDLGELPGATATVPLMEPLVFETGHDAPGEEFHEGVSGLLRRGDRLLLVLRGPTREWAPDSWDVPGGHVEIGEDEPAALVRELREELGIEVAPSDAALFARLKGSNFDVGYYVVSSWTGEPHNAAPNEHVKVAWCSRGELPDLVFSDANILPIAMEALR